jgi:hypothetical protein
VSRFTDWLERLLGDPGGRLRYARERAMVQAAEERAALKPDGLKPCPFCGGEPSVLQLGNGPGGMSVDCLNRECLVQPNTFSTHATDADALSAWNRRAGG